LLREQDGVVARRQLVTLGASETDVRRLLSRGELVPVHPRVYVNHSGRPTRSQQRWAAVLACAPAALHRESALDAHGMTRDRPPPREDRQIHVLVDRSRRIVPPPGVSVERVTDRSTWVLDNRRPPRAPLTEVLADVAAGTRSVLEQRYLRDVERAHDLPTGERQLRAATASGTVQRDIRYPARRALVELDGAFGHRDAVDRWADLQRDLDAALDDHLTLRAGWAQVLEPCRLADVVATILRRRGWSGQARPCRDHRSIDSGGRGRT
jgi:hypothetical protein